MIDTALLERRPKPEPAVAVIDRDTVQTYRDICAEVGVVNPEIVIDGLNYFLNDHDLPVFSLPAVVSYMDDLTAVDNPSKMGWEWRPVREKDRIEQKFGRPATDDREARRRALMQMYADAMMQAPRGGFFSTGPARAFTPKIEVVPPPVITPASDYYHGADAKLYDRAVPLHALKKIAMIEKQFGGGRVAFMITDYVTQPHIVIQPDPFLMAVVPNKDLAKGVGRFVIDVWDEPGFGIAQMLK